jgi:small redox-active disulfide protein 2
MKKLQILGTGCAKCNALTEATKKAADEIGFEYEIAKVTEIRDIMSFGVMMTPALVVDGAVKITGKVPGHAELKALLSAAK